MRSTALFIIPGLLFSMLSQAQDKKQKLRFTDISIATGMESFSDRTATNSFLIEQISESELIPANIEDYRKDGAHFSNSSGSFEIMAGFAWRDKESKSKNVNKRLRIGLAYSQPSLLSTGYYLNHSYAYDTLVSARTGQEFYVDSTYNSQLSANYNVSRLALNTAFLWTTNDDARVSFYGGVNLNFSLNFSSSVDLNRSDLNYLTNNEISVNYREEQINIIENSQESFAQPSSFGFGFSSPLGIDWRVGRQEKPLNDLHVFLEMNPGVSFNDIPNYELMSQFRNSIHLGLRFSM